MPRKQQDGPVTLRRKSLVDGRASLYLDIYLDGRRSYEFLKLHLVREKTRADKEQNRQTLQLANAIRARRIVEIQSGRFGFRAPRHIGVADFFDECAEEAERKVTEATAGLWRACRRHVADYCGGKSVPLSSVSSGWVDGFADFLRGRGLSGGSVQQYVAKLRCCLNKAVARELISPAVLAGTAHIRKEDAERMYLTVDELRRLTATPCGRADVRAAFLFSCLTGLRHSDIEAMRWGDVTRHGGMTRVVFRQRKTHNLEYLDISPEAERYMGERRADDERVFPLGVCHAGVNRCIGKWTEAAGIAKHITFHCARHTFATLMLELDVDIYTVSKLLGHADISTTQIYAKVVDKKKQRAVGLIPSIEAGDGRKRGGK